MCHRSVRRLSKNCQLTPPWNSLSECGLGSAVVGFFVTGLEPALEAALPCLVPGIGYSRIMIRSSFICYVIELQLTRNAEMLRRPLFTSGATLDFSKNLFGTKRRETRIIGTFLPLP